MKLKTKFPNPEILYTKTGRKENTSYQITIKVECVVLDRQCGEIMSQKGISPIYLTKQLQFIAHIFIVNNNHSSRGLDCSICLKECILILLL
jgi:hypothetical protein